MTGTQTTTVTADSITPDARSHHGNGGEGTWPIVALSDTAALTTSADKQTERRGETQSTVGLGEGVSQRRPD